jgi:phage-related baseplate assembly protein
MSLLDNQLPEPSFVTRDVGAITRDMVAMYEELTGKTLYPAQVERLLVNIAAYREILVREAIQDAAKLNLVRYSRAPVLDYLGENIGVGRLAASRAGTVLRFTFNPVPTVSALLPAGTLVEGGGVSFATTSSVTVSPGAASIDIEALCVDAGAVGNGFVAGQIKNLASAVSGLSVATAVNVTTSAGGSEAEDDEHFRERIVLAPGQFSTAGSVGSYKFHALSADPAVTDVAVLSPVPGSVVLYPLVSTGLPSAATKATVLAACSSDRVRPLTDTVSVADPVQVGYTINAQLTCYLSADAAAARDAAAAGANAFVARVRAGLGRDVVRTQLISELHVYGVYSVALIQPAADLVVDAGQWAVCTAVNVTVVGSAQG